MGLSRYNPTKATYYRRTIPLWVRKYEQHNGRGYSRFPLLCEKCNIKVSLAGTRQILCKPCKREADLIKYRDPARYKKRRQKLEQNPTQLKKYLERCRIRQNKLNKLKSITANRHCDCGERISFNKKFCRSCVAKKRKHFYKFLTCTIENCIKKHLAKGLCSKHYQ